MWEAAGSDIRRSHSSAVNKIVKALKHAHFAQELEMTATATNGRMTSTPVCMSPNRRWISLN
jgi:hypothetical protein